MKKLFICFLITSPVIVYSQKFVGDICNLPSSGSGVCKLLPECPSALEDLQKLQKFPQTCGFQGTTPIVCCTEGTSTTTTTTTPTTTTTVTSVQNRIPGEISKQKCREYSKFIIEKKVQPILLLTPPTVTKNECGHKVVKLIVGGEKAGRREFPHMAALGYDKDNTGSIQWLCGGTIISQKYILTAAHCLFSPEFGHATHVLAGVANLNDTSTHNQQIRISERIAYPKYRSSSHYYDIGLLKLEKPIKISSYARPACLYTNSEITAQQSIATGWGNIAYAGASSEDLRKVTLDLFDQEFCNKSYRNQIGRKLKRGIVEEMQLCAGSLDEEKDTCQGDSGGPLQIYHVNDDIKCMYDIVGVTSFGKACSGSPGVYTRVSTYIKWVEDIVWPNE